MKERLYSGRDYIDDEGNIRHMADYRDNDGSAQALREAREVLDSESDEVELSDDALALKEALEGQNRIELLLMEFPLEVVKIILEAEDHGVSLRQNGAAQDRIRRLVGGMIRENSSKLRRAGVIDMEQYADVLHYISPVRSTNVVDMSQRRTDKQRQGSSDKVRDPDWHERQMKDW